MRGRHHEGLERGGLGRPMGCVGRDEFGEDVPKQADLEVAHLVLDDEERDVPELVAGEFDLVLLVDVVAD